MEERGRLLPRLLSEKLPDGTLPAHKLHALKLA